MDQEAFYSILSYSLSAFFSIGINAVFFLRARKSPLLSSFLNVQYIIILWLLANCLKAAAPNLEVAWLWMVLQYLSICMFGIIFLDFAYLYNTGKYLPPLVRTTCYAISGLNYVVVFSNPLHNLFFASYTQFNHIAGPAYLVHTLWSYLLLAIAYTLIIKSLVYNRYTLSRMQVLIFNVGLLSPVLVNVTYVLGITEMPFDITPIVFNVTSLIFGYTAYRYRFLDIKKVTRYMVLENIHEGIIITDSENRILLSNPVIRENLLNFEDSSQIVDLHEFFESVSNRVQNAVELEKRISQSMQRDQRKLIEEVSIFVDGTFRTYIMKLERLEDSAGDRIGYLLRMIDITQQKDILTSVEEKNDALIRINQQLSENITAAKQLAVAKERSRVSKEIHDILGHTMTVAISLLEIAKRSTEENTNFAKEKVNQSIEIIRTGLRELKDAMRKHAGGTMEANVLNEDLSKLMDDFEHAGVKVDYYYKNSNVKLSTGVYDTVYRICQEGLTNALKHGKATTITVGLRYVERHIDLFIIDDGGGCGQVVKGNGIKGMENRVNELAGYFSCGSPEGDGFNIHVTLPYMS